MFLGLVRVYQGQFQGLMSIVHNTFCIWYSGSFSRYIPGESLEASYSNLWGKVLLPLGVSRTSWCWSNSLADMNEMLTEIVDTSLSCTFKDEECHSVEDASTYSWYHAMDLGHVLKSLINITAFINEIQLFMYDKSNIYFKSSIYNYVHSSSIKLRATPIKRYIHIYISLLHDCNANLIGCFHTGISIM